VCGQTLKFELAVSSNVTTTADDATSTSTTTVSADVYEDYSFTVTMPSKTAQVSASNVTVAATMQDVSGLKVDGARSHDVTVNTGIDGITVPLAGWLSNCYKFQDANVNVDISGKKLVYNIGAATESDNGSYTITGTVTSLEDAQAAWTELVQHVKTDGKTDGDNSYITIANGSWLQIGDKVLMFETKDDLTLDDLNKKADDAEGKTSGMTALVGKVQKAVTLVDATDAKKAGLDVVIDSNANTVKALLKENTTLAVSSSWAVLTDDATITIDGLNLSTKVGSKTLGGVLEKLKTDANNSTLLVLDAVNYFNALVGAVDASPAVNVNITFSKSEDTITDESAPEETPEVITPITPAEGSN
jgi:hypothetical protein